MKNAHEDTSCTRRSFLRAAAIAGGAAAAGIPTIDAAFAQEETRDVKQVEEPLVIKTNIATALATPKLEHSMPGYFPGVVSEVQHAQCMNGRIPVDEAAEEMLAEGMKSLTGEKDARDAWARFFNIDECIGIKVNSVGGQVIGTTHAVAKAVVKALESIGVPRKNMQFWEHYQMGLDSWGMTQEHYPGIGSITQHYMIEKDGKKVPGGMDRLDMDVYYEADYVIPDEQNELEYMLHGGEKSYFPKFLTQDVNKIINIPSLKHHIASFVALAFKNLAYGALSNCVRGHFFIDRFNAEVCAFPPLRDKAVLHILDGLRAQYDKGPGPNARFIWTPKKVWCATDPVAIDKIGFEEVFNKRVEIGMHKAEELDAFYKEYNYLAIAENLGLGIFRSRPIDLRKSQIGQAG